MQPLNLSDKYQAAPSTLVVVEVHKVMVLLVVVA
jgi:hypothetical protein